MLTGQLVAFNELFADGTRDLLRGMVDTMKQRTQSSLVAMGRLTQVTWTGWRSAASSRTGPRPRHSAGATRGTGGEGGRAVQTSTVAAAPAASPKAEPRPASAGAQHRSSRTGTTPRPNSRSRRHPGWMSLRGMGDRNARRPRLPARAAQVADVPKEATHRNIETGTPRTGAPEDPVFPYQPDNATVQRWRMPRPEIERRRDRDRRTSAGELLTRPVASTETAESIGSNIMLHRWSGQAEP